MFKLLYRAVCLTIFFGGWGLAALSLHVVRTPDKIGLIPKERLGITDTYVDARKWTLADVPAHSELVKRLLEANKAEWFHYMADPSGGDIAGQLRSAIGNDANQPADTDSVLGRVKGLFGSATGAAAATKAGFDLPALPVDF